MKVKYYLPSRNNYIQCYDTRERQNKLGMSRAKLRISKHNFSGKDRLRIRSVKLLYILQKNWTLILEQIKVDIVQA